MCTKVLEIVLPSYRIDTEIEYDVVGEKIDGLLEGNLEDGKYVERSIGLVDHPEKTIDGLANLILKCGTDKYDRERKSKFDAEFSCYGFDIHGNEFEMNSGILHFKKEHSRNTFYGQNIYCFHKLARFDRGYSVRIGISMIYDREKLLSPLKLGKCEERIEKYDKYLYRFRDNEALEALIAVIKIR